MVKTIFTIKKLVLTRPNKDPIYIIEHKDHFQLNQHCILNKNATHFLWKDQKYNKYIIWRRKVNLFYFQHTHLKKIAGIMLNHTWQKRHLIILPPPKRPFFL